MADKNPARIFLSPPHMSGAERRYVEEAFDSNYIAPLGPFVDKLEACLIEHTGSQHAAALSSGTAALHLALLIQDVKAGDDVICPLFTFAASANPIVYIGATPVFVDSEPDTWNMDPGIMEEAIIDRKRITGRYPAAIILVHLYGMPAQIDEIMVIAGKYDIPIIEDAAEAFGARYASRLQTDVRPPTSGLRPPLSGLRSPTSGLRPVGTFGCMGVLSFNGNKIITTSGGGALVSDEADLINRARFLATQARDPAPHYQHSEIGYNYRMSNIVAAIGCGQMEALPKFVNRCREINKTYKQELGCIEGLQFLNEPNERYASNYWLTTLTLDASVAGKNREDVRFALEAENIESRPLWKPMHLQPVYQQMQAPMYGGEVCQELFRDGLCLPSGVGMTNADISRVCDIVRKTLKGTTA